MDSPINLKKSLRDRMEKAEVEGPAEMTAPVAAAQALKFGKKWTEAEKAAQAKALADKLRNR